MSQTQNTAGFLRFKIIYFLSTAGFKIFSNFFLSTVGFEIFNKFSLSINVTNFFLKYCLVLRFEIIQLLSNAGVKFV